MTQKIYGYQIWCANEWCSGAEVFGFSEKNPEVGIKCPTCGRIADIRILSEEDQEEK